MKTFTLKEYANWMSRVQGRPGVLLKPVLNYTFKRGVVYNQRCDCIRDFNGYEMRAYEDCDDCLGKGTPAIPIGELKE